MISPTLPFTLPMVGLGTWKLCDETAGRVVRDAVALGYRHIDTATGYHNEEAVGAGIRASGVDRDELLIVSKFPEEVAGLERLVLQRSLDLLGLRQLDLWLIHAPPENGGAAAIWEHFVSARDDGLVRAIGVSDFSPAQVDRLIDETGVAPQVNQVAFGPRHFDPELLPHHTECGVTVVGHSPFTGNDLTQPTLHAIAERHGRTVRQVLLRWHWDHGVPVVVKSASREHLTENLAVADFRLTAEDVDALDALAGR